MVAGAWVGIVDGMAGGFKAIRGGVAGGRALAGYFERSECGAAAEYYVAGENRSGVVQVARWRAGGVGRAGVAQTGQTRLGKDSYARWLAGFDPDSGEARGAHRKGEMRESVLAWEHAVTASKTLSVAAAIDPGVAAALTVAFDDATAAVAQVVASRGVVRVGGRGSQVQVPVSAVETATVDHFSSRAGDPHRHRHVQVNARVQVEVDGEIVWRAIDSRALLKGLIGEVNAAERAAIATNPGLRGALAVRGWELGADGEIVQLLPVKEALSGRSRQVKENVAVLEAGWRAAHPGEEPDRATVRAWDQRAWAAGREAKDPAWTVQALRDRAVAACESAGVDWRPAAPLQPSGPVAGLPVERLAAGALARLGAGRSAWSAGDVHAAIDEAIRGSGWAGGSAERVGLHDAAAAAALSGCVSILPEEIVKDALVQSKHLTTPAVLAADRLLHQRLAYLAGQPGRTAAAMGGRLGGLDLDVEQQAAAGLIAGTAGLGVVEGVAGAGKTRMLVAAQGALAAGGRVMVVVTPTLKAAEAARGEGVGVATSVHKLLFEHGWRWDQAGNWRQLRHGETDPATGRAFTGGNWRYVLPTGAVVVVDEAGMLDVPTAVALTETAQRHGWQLRLVGDRAQLAAVGRGGVMDTALKYTDAGQQAVIGQAHRFRTWDPTRAEWTVNTDYANLAARIRRREDPAETFRAMTSGVGSATRTAADLDGAYDLLAAAVAADPKHLVVVPTNADVAEVNTRTRTLLVAQGAVDDTRTVLTGGDLRVGVGDRIVTRRNDPDLGVANRETFTVTRVHDDGSVIARSTADTARLVTLPADYVTGRTADGVALVQHAYATTGHGAQGATVDDATVLVTGRTDAAGLYVGVTRGRLHNTAIIVAEDDRAPERVWAAAATRVRADTGIDAARAAAEAEIRDVRPAPLTADETAQARAVLDKQILPALETVRQWATYRQTMDRRERAKAEWVAGNGDPAAMRGKAGQIEQKAGQVEERVAQARQARIWQAAADAARNTERALYQVAAARGRLNTAGMLHRRQARRDLDDAIDRAIRIAPAVPAPADWGHYGNTRAWQRQIINQAETAAAHPTPSEQLQARAASAARQQADAFTARAEQAEHDLAAHLGPQPAEPTHGRDYRRQPADRLQQDLTRLQHRAETLDPDKAQPDTVRNTLGRIHAENRQRAEQAEQREAEARRNRRYDYHRSVTHDRGPSIGM